MIRISTVAVAALFLVAGGPSVWASETNLPTTGKLAFSLEQMNCMSSDSQNQIPCPEKSRA